MEEQTRSNGHGARSAPRPQQSQLDGFVPLELSTCGPTAAADAARPRVRHISFSPAAGRGVTSLSQQCRVSPFVALLGSFVVLLRRYTGQDEIALHATGPIGPALVQVDLGDDPPLREALRRVGVAYEDALTDQPLTPRDLVGGHNVDPRVADVVARVRFACSGVEVQRGPAGPVHLALTVSLQAGSLAGDVEFDASLFDEPTIDRLAGHLEVILDGAARDPEEPLSRLSILTAQEWHHLVVESNAATHPIPDCGIHELFERWARSTPDKVAAVHEGESVTYGELDRWAGAVARRLMAEGVGPEVIVALWAERSLATLAGMLGILKAGGAFLPVDPAYPQERIRYMLQDSGCRLLLASRQAATQPPDLAKRRIWIEHVSDRDAGGATEGAHVEGRSLAYVVYTSGSTGRPKGVEIEHRSVVNVVLTGIEHMGLGPDDRVQQFASLSWDVAVGELLTPLSAGASLVMPGRPLVSVGEVLDLARRAGSTVVSLPTAYWRAWAIDATHSGANVPAGIRLVGFGGEKCDVRDVVRWNERVGIRCFNGYGPTEACISTTVYYILKGAQLPGVVPIGRPLPNTAVYILDGHLNPMPIGVPGELFIAGVGLARGYVNRPELTSERFLRSPFGPSGTERLYRTGDLARHLPDGNIDFLGRLDEQVKVRGVRIEPGEIEAVLEAHPGVRDAVVLAREDTPGEKRLVAYVIPAAGSDPQGKELRAWLFARLPAYMVPAAFVPVPALPLTPNGKVDRHALPAPRQRARDQERLVEPATPSEHTLAEIWAEVLGTDAVSVEDDFFDLGGDSLTAAQMIARVGQRFGIEVPLRTIFDRRTVREVARAVDDGRDDSEVVEVTPELVALQRTDQTVLSFGQERLWFLDQLVPSSPLYNISTAYQIMGPLDTAVLGRAFDELVARHEVLRTVFEAVDGRPVPRVEPRVDAEVHVTDLSSTESAEGDAALRDLAASEASRPFDLTRAPMLRVRMVRRSPTHHVLLVTTHHIVADAWSIAVLLHELGNLYRAFARDEPPPLRALPVQYADFAAWQRRSAGTEALGRQLEFWVSELTPAPAVIELPTDRPRPPRPSYAGAGLDFRLSRPTADTLQAVGRDHGATLFMALLAVFDVLLANYTGRDEVVVGTPVAGRLDPQLEGLIGFFVNILPLRAHLAENPTYAELLEQVRETALAAFSHQDVPFERLVLALRPARDLTRNPIVQVLFQLLPRSGRTPLDLGEQFVCEDLGALRGTPGAGFEGPSLTAPFDLHLLMAELPDGSLAGRIVFATELFERASVDRLARQFVALVEAFAADPQRRVWEVELAGDERDGPPASARPEPAGGRLHEFVEAQVDRTPDAVAVVSEHAALGYADLDRRANRLARHLRGLGVGRDVVVGMCLERSPEFAVGTLGILKAGGAVLPLDPCFPPARLAFMLDDASAPVVLTRDALRRRLPTDAAEVIRLDADWPEIARHSPARLGEGGTLEDLAYVIYTSGSTGRPKGVMLTHAGLVNHNRAMIDLFELGPEDRVLQFCSIGFDVSIQEIFTGWAAGATVVFRPESLPVLGREWRQWVQEQRLTVLTLPTGYWHEWIRDLQATGETVPEHVRLTFVAGEKALGPAYRAWLRLAGRSARWINGYGPAEASVIAAVYEPAGREPGAGDPPIGRPIRNVVIHVLDRHGRPVPDGARGELCIGGAAVARGYLGSPQLTASKFVPDPFAGPPARLYRTGDLGRRLPAGDLQYLGRVDRQVKIGGFRVEPDEVESALVGHAQVDDAVVVATEGERGDRRLVAYVVANDERTDHRDLRAFLSDRLPGHMVPSTFVLLDALPLTANGKVDRDSLPPPPEIGGTDSTRGEHQTWMHEQIAAIWADVLHTERVGINDNFFDLGGHSLLAAQVMARVRQVFTVNVPLRAIFEAPTVGGLAAAVEQRKERPTAAAPLGPYPRRPGDRIPLSLPQDQMLALELQAEPRGLYNVTASHRFARPIDPCVLQAALSFLVGRHEILRTRFGWEGGHPYQVVEQHLDVPVGVANLTEGRPGDRQDRLGAGIAQQDALPFELSDAPLLRARWFCLDDDESVLAVTFDHMICDGPSAYHFLGELSAVYDALSDGRRPPLSPLTVQYGDFALWQRAWLTEARLQTELEYWKQQLDGVTLGPAIPFDSRPQDPSRRILRRALDVSPETYGGLARLARARRTTLFTVCATAVAALSGAYGGRQDIVLSTTLSGRHHRETAEMVGLFSGISRIRIDLSAHPTLDGLLPQAHQTVVTMLDNCAIPFMRVRTALFPDFPTGGVEGFAALPNEFSYYRIPPRDPARLRPVDELYTRGQLHPLSFTFADDGTRLWGQVSIKLDWYSRNTMDALAEGLEWLLAAVAVDPGLPLSAVPGRSAPRRNAYTS